MHWLFRMSKWARNPPSERQVKLVLAVIAVCFMIYAVERWIGWPDWMTIEGGTGRFPLR
ncbi:hypothetical protein TG4357_00169 [Thalassovita gelatinovora]|uniref:Uncharacterized protein n=1 Tax=Thalassovita gelatinovora TaxID=53501 RepID=A0A0P1F4F6_THAGE|nr:hypothetical protein [Thalassovita gelatinovora]QIZ79307.1 hypothetical protein HFZ77_01890 [Thalassovita gelatinovora]CUH62543.1 hypothetical protein TG4357_00169 [Thalassovita gelatinovora]SEQ06269.1 hypothetical protein SAMN04488043_10369 [Thalassovita gelatinovora]